MIRKGASHFHIWASFKPSGTPSAAAAEKAVMMMPMPRARRSAGTTSATMVIRAALLTPPKAPHIARAAISIPGVFERPQARVPKVKPA